MTPEPTGSPPRLATLLIRARLPRELAQAVTGDLEEEYRARVFPACGRVRADLWYWGQAMTLRAGALRRSSRRLVAMRPTWERNRPRHVGNPQPDLGSAMPVRIHDLTYAARRLARTPGFTLVAVLSLGLGIGINTTVFTALDASFMRPLGIPHDDDLVRFEWPSFTYPEYADMSADLTSLAGLVATRRVGVQLRTVEGSESLLGSDVSPNYFTALGIQPAVGRFFTADDRGADAGRVVVLGYDLWMRRFGGDPRVVGRVVTLNERPCTVLGVAARGFDGEARIPRSELWMPVDVSAGDVTHATRDFALLGRLKPGRTAAQVQADAVALATRLAWPLPLSPTGQRLVVWTEARANADHGGRLMYLIMPLVCLVLLVACANVSGLLLARHEEHRRDLALRLALGAGRFQLIRQMLTEGLLLAVVGTGVGLLLTAWSGRLLTSLVPTSLSALALHPHLNGRVLGLSLGLSLLAAVASSLVPALRATRLDPGPVLKGDAGSPSAGLRGLAGRNLLVVGQLAVSTVFLVVTLLFVRGFLSGTRTDPGFSERNLLLVTVSPETSHLGRAGARDYYRRLQERVSALPEVRATSLAAHPPLGLSGGGMTIPVRRPEAADADPDGLRTRYNVVEPRYFDALGIRLLAGRDFNDHEDEDAQRVTIVSEALARRYWPGQDPLGRTLSIGASPAEYEVVGVAQDVAVIGMNETPEPYLYLPYRQTSAGFMTLLVAVRGSPALLAPAVRQAMRAVDDGVAPFSVETMPDLVRFALMPQWIGAWSGAALGGLTVVLAVGGLFALVAYAVSRRTHEIGIRMALGARRRTTLWMVVRQGLYLGLAGVGLGLPLAVALGYVLRSLFFGIAPADPPALAGASLAVVAVALLASLGPAHRATRVDPMTALRSE